MTIYFKQFQFAHQNNSSFSLVTWNYIIFINYFQINNIKKTGLFSSTACKISINESVLYYKNFKVNCLH